MSVHVTEGLLEALLDLAREADPESLSIALGATRADGFGADPPEGLSPETRVLTHLYPPEVGGSITAVFGVDLGTPAGDTAGRFVSHPDGRSGVSVTDDLHGTVLVAVPPWTREAVAAFDRHGRELGMTVVAAEPDIGSLPE